MGAAELAEAVSFATPESVEEDAETGAQAAEPRREFNIFRNQKQDAFELHKAYKFRADKLPAKDSDQYEQLRNVRFVLAPMEGSARNKSLGALIRTQQGGALIDKLQGVQQVGGMDENEAAKQALAEYPHDIAAALNKAGHSSLADDVRNRMGLKDLDEGKDTKLIERLCQRKVAASPSYLKRFWERKEQNEDKPDFATQISCPCGDCADFDYGALVVHKESQAVGDVLLEMSVGVNVRGGTATGYGSSRDLDATSPAAQGQEHRFISRFWPFTLAQWRRNAKQTGVCAPKPKAKAPDAMRLSVALHCAALLAFGEETFHVDTNFNIAMANLIREAVGQKTIDDEGFAGSVSAKLRDIANEWLEEDLDFGKGGK